jgi:hypothetical protein
MTIFESHPMKASVLGVKISGQGIRIVLVVAIASSKNSRTGIEDEGEDGPRLGRTAN